MNDYTFRVKYINGEYETTCDQLPDLSIWTTDMLQGLLEIATIIEDITEMTFL